MRFLIVFPGVRHSIYEVALGYEEALKDLGHEVFSFHLEDYIDYHAGAIKYWKDTNPAFNPDQKQQTDFWMEVSGNSVLPHIFETRPQVILIVGGTMLHGKTIEMIKRFPSLRAVILTECPYVDDRQARFLGAIEPHMVFVNEKNSVGAFGFPTVYLPHSYSPHRHFPGAVDDTHKSDVFFCGTWWPERARLFDGLDDEYNAHVIGVGWDDDVGNTQFITPNGELVNWYRGAKIALNHHRTIRVVDRPDHIQEGEAWSIGPRAYEIAACGAFQLCDDTRPELREVFGDTVDTYFGALDLRFKIDYFLRNESHRKLLAKEALAAVQDCSFENRAKAILIPALEAI